MCAPSSRPVPALGQHLAEPGVVLHRPPVGHVAVRLHVHRVVEALGPALLLGAPDGGDLRLGEHRRRHEAVIDGLRCVGVQQVVRHDLRLVVRDVLELERRADVAERVHAVHRGALVLVDDDPAVRVGRDAPGGQVEAVAVGPPARGDEQQVTADDVPVGQVEHDLGAVAADPHGLGPQVHVPAVAGQCGEPLGHRLVLAAQHRRAPPDHRHGAAERGEHVRELRGDVARAQDDQPLGQGVDAHHRVRGVERHPRLRDDPSARSAAIPLRSRCGPRRGRRRGPRCAARRAR